MLDDTANDNTPDRSLGDADGDGHAALLLVESLIHGLVERSVIKVQDAVDIVNTAVEVQDQAVREHELSPAAWAKALSVLQSIQGSISIDLPTEEG